jgi:hypothetical protein
VRCSAAVESFASRHDQTPPSINASNGNFAPKCNALEAVTRTV